MLRSLHRPSAPRNRHGQALQEVPPQQSVPARRRTRPPPRAAPRVGRAADANPGAADMRAHGRAYRAHREPHGSPYQADHRRDAGKARAGSTCWLRATTDRSAQRGDDRRPHHDDGGRSSGDGPNDQADGRARPLSRLRVVAAPRPGGGGVASPRNVAAARNAVSARRRAREIFLLAKP